MLCNSLHRFTIPEEHTLALAVGFSETLVPIYHTTWRHIPQHHNPLFLYLSSRKTQFLSEKFLQLSTTSFAQKKPFLFCCHQLSFNHDIILTYEIYLFNLSYGYQPLGGHDSPRINWAITCIFNNATTLNPLYIHIPLSGLGNCNVKVVAL
jgi:hypothetical protein